MTAKNVIPGGKFVPKGVAGKAASGIARILGIGITEETTETVTGMGQQRVESEVTGEEEPRQWTSGDDWLKTAREVLPQVILLTGVMGAGGAAYRNIKKDGTGDELKGKIRDSITDVYDSSERTPEQTVESILDGYKGQLFDDKDVAELSKKYPELKEDRKSVV